MCALHCAQLLHTILHRTHLIIFPLTLQTITIAPMMSIWGKGVSELDVGHFLKPSPFLHATQTTEVIAWRNPSHRRNLAMKNYLIIDTCRTKIRYLLHFFVIQRDVRLKMLTESSEQYGDKNLNFFAATLYKTSHLSRLNTTHLNPQKVVILRPTPIQSNPCCPLQIRVNALSIKTFAGFGLRWRIQSGYWEQLSHAREWPEF